MTIEHRLKEALACVRKINSAVEMIQRNEMVLHPYQVANELSSMRVELSVAAGHLAVSIDEIEAVAAKGGSS